MLVVCDIDGTLMDISHRRHFVAVKPKNWPAFFKATEKDTPNWPVVNMVNALLMANHKVIFASGRNESQRVISEKQINTCFPQLSDITLYMRADKDNRPDFEVKREILDQIVIDFGRKPDMAIDDRKQVVDMWIANGVFVLDVAQGNGDF